MSKYEGIKRWKALKSRGRHECSRCSGSILPRDSYYRESTDPVRPPPGLVLRALCADCYEVNIQATEGDLLR